MNIYRVKLMLVGVFLSLQCVSPFMVYADYYEDISDHLLGDFDKRISMDFNEATLNDVLKMFSQQAGLNFVSSVEISSKSVNLYLDNVPVREALQHILSANGLTYTKKKDSNVFVVKEYLQPEVELETKVYPLQFASVPSSKIFSTLSSGGSDLGDGAGESGGSGDSSPGILEVVQAILTSDGSVAEDVRTNSLIVTDIPSQFVLIDKTIFDLDVRIPQILIEVEMLDVSKNVADLMGVKFGDTPLTFSGGQRDNIFPFAQNKLLSKGYTYAEDQYRVGTVSFSGLTLALQFLRTHTDTRNLARPRLLTLNNETAEIQIITDEAIGIKSVSSGADATAQTVAEAERVETGVSLKVTPQINMNTNEITMAIEPKVIQARRGQSFQGQDFRDPENRGVKSILRVTDGDTVVIGGLIRSDVANTKSGVPYLSQVPLLGRFLRHKDLQTTQRELVIFITPHILKDVVHAKKDVDVGVTPLFLEREQDVPMNKYVF